MITSSCEWINFKYSIYINIKQYVPRDISLLSFLRRPSTRKRKYLQYEDAVSLTSDKQNENWAPKH